MVKEYYTSGFMRFFPKGYLSSDSGSKWLPLWYWFLRTFYNKAPREMQNFWAWLIGFYDA